MTPIDSRSSGHGDVFDDPRLRFFQDFVTKLLQKLPELPQLQGPEEFEELQKELFVVLNKKRRRLVEAYGDETFLASVGLADELLQDADWPGREWWQQNLLELKTYRTRTVGDRFYEIIDRLLNDRKQSDLPLAMVLLDTMALGFRGRLSGNPEEETRWCQYRDGLANWIREMSEDTDSRRHGTNSPIDYRSKQISLPGIPSLRRWVALAGLAFVGILFYSHLLWWSQVAPAHRAVNEATAVSSVDDAITANDSEERELFREGGVE